MNIIVSLMDKRRLLVCFGLSVGLMAIFLRIVHDSIYRDETDIDLEMWLLMSYPLIITLIQQYARTFHSKTSFFSLSLLVLSIIHIFTYYYFLFDYVFVEALSDLEFYTWMVGLSLFHGLIFSLDPEVKWFQD